MYKKLIDIYEGDVEQRKCVLLQEFFNYTFKKGSIATHISDLQNIVFKLKSINSEVDDSMLMSKILSALPEQYKHFISAWDSANKNEKTLSNLTSRLLMEEKRVGENDRSEEAVAFKAYEKKGASTSGRKCFRCHKPGHLANQCRKKEFSYKCNICKKNNHEEKDCYFRKNKKPESTKQKQEISFLVESNTGITKDFVVDSGSSSHMVNDIKLFKEIQQTTSEIAVAKKSESMNAQGIGEVKTEDCTLKKVLYVPELSKNLLSVNSITQNGGEVKFTKNAVKVYKDNIKVLEGNKEDNGLYVIKLKQENLEHAMVTTMSANVWHRRMGHLGRENLKKLENLVDGMVLNKEDLKQQNGLCEICLKGKQVRQPFTTERTRATRPLEIIHTDVCGPIMPATWDNQKYFLTFLDDYTHFAVVYLMEGKYEVNELVKEYVNTVEAKWNMKISKLRCDNGGEYANNDLKYWCKKRGIVLDYTVPYSPQLNGKAERLNRTLMEKSRCLIADSELNKEMWGEAVRVATYLHNRSPSTTIDTTPYEKWNLKKPDLKTVHIFGCDAHAKVLGNLKKLDDRSKKYKMVGYTLNGYRLWDEDDRTISIHKDVVFEEKLEKGTNIMHEREVNEETEDQEEAVVNREDEDNDNESTKSEKKEDNSEEIGAERSTRGVKPKRFEDYVLLTYEEAVSGSDKEKWNQAIKEEKESLEKNKTWTLVERDEVKDKRILSNKWVFKVKNDGRYKARLVIRGCEQKQGVDYNEIYSPVISSSSLRIILALAAMNHYDMIGFDIKTAFLYGNLTEEIFMEIPEGYNTEKNKICKLNKSLYGLKQAPMLWNKCFTNFLKENGLTQITTEHCIFKTEDGELILAIYVDDGIIIGKNLLQIQTVLEKLKTRFEIKVYSELKTFLGIEIEKLEDGITLKQSSYAEEILRRYRMTDAKSVKTPIETTSDIKSETENKNSAFPFREVIGSLLYLTNKTRPDMTYAVNYNSRFVENPSATDITNVKRVLKYLVGTVNVGLKFCVNSDTKTLDAYCDADYAGDTTTRKSTTGYVIYYGGSPISWCSRLQPIVALSSTEAEFIAAAECAKELLYLKELIHELTGEKVNVNLHIDNQSAMCLIKNGVMNKRSKHIDVRFKFICEKVNKGDLNIVYCPTEEQIADVLTKPLKTVKFEKFKNVLCNV